MMKIEFISALCLSDPEACKKLIVQEVPPAALYEQMAEEAAELAKASLKMARVIRSENPTPVTQREAMAQMVEELSDLMVVCDVAEVAPDEQIKEYKLKRWAERIFKRKWWAY
jgi:multidrug resistance efflux pump